MIEENIKRKKKLYDKIKYIHDKIIVTVGQVYFFSHIIFERAIIYFRVQISIYFAVEFFGRGRANK